MRIEMKTIWNGLRAIRYKGKLTSFGFTMDEIIEIIDQEGEERTVAKLENEKLFKTRMLPSARRELLIKDEIISEDKAFECKRRYLEQEIKDLSRNYYETPKEWRTKEQLDKLQKAKWSYEIYTFRPQDDTRIPEEDIELARSVDIHNYIKVNLAGFAPCPFHKEKTPSLHIYKNFYYCFGCGKKGDVISLIMETQNLDFRQAVSLLTGKTYDKKESRVPRIR